MTGIAQPTGKTTIFNLAAPSQGDSLYPQHNVFQ